MEHYHNDSVIGRIAEEEGVSLETATRYFQGALQFLQVASAAGSPVSPSLPIDAAWHAFILHTRDYADYCERQFGRFIHHQPTVGVSNRDNYLRARAIAEEHFGELDEVVWPTKARKVSACSDPDGECTGQCGPENDVRAVLVTGDCAPDTDCNDDGHCDGS